MINSLLPARVFTFLLLLLVSSTQASVIISTTSLWKYVKGFSEASTPDPTAWRAIAFDDSAWLVGQAPFYYENSPGSTTAYSGHTQLNDMFGGYTCILMRQTFVLPNVTDVSQLQLYALSDDGFIAWLNGTEIARFNMPPGDVPFDGSSSPALAEPVPPQMAQIDNPGFYLVPGTNVLTIQAFNSSLSGSSDFLIEASLSYTSDTTPPTVLQLIPADGAIVRSLSSIEVDFSEGVAGVVASDLLIDGQPATNVTQFGPAQYVFDFQQPATGAVTVAWAANQGIHDLAGNPNPFAGGSYSYLLDPNAPVTALQISEFMASNKKTLHDEDGDSSDWIEIFNPTASSVNLDGWALTDDPKNLTQWKFPNYSMGAKSYLVVFASGKNRTNATAEPHTNFQLASGGEFLALVDPSTNVVSSFTPKYPPQQTDVSYGRDRAAPNVTGYFTTPTPGQPNLDTGAGFAPEVSFQVAGRTFTTPFFLALWTTSTNAEIRFTLDGSDPSELSALYIAPISITNTAQVRTRAFQAGLLPGPLHSETFILLNPNLINSTTDLPVIVLHNFGAGSVPVSVPQLVDFSIYEPQNRLTSLTNPPTLSTRAGIHVRGSSTQGLPKQSWAVEFWDANGDSLNKAPLDLPADSDWVLYAPNNFEPVLMHNPLIYELSNEIGRYAPRTRFVIVYINTTGGALASADYNGIYVLEEKIKIGKDRVDIDKLQPENNAPPSVTGGYQMKIDRPGSGESGFFAAGQSIVYVDPQESEMLTPQRAPQQQYLQSYMDSFGNALNGANYRDPTNGYRAYVDVNSWIDHHILNVMSFNVDALRLSAYFYKERNGKLFFGPIWDFDRSQGSTDGRDFNPRIWRSPVPDFGTDFFNYPWWGRMFTDVDFWQAWIDRYESLRNGILSTNHIFADIDALAAKVKAEQPREANRWSSLTRPRSGLVSISGYAFNFSGTYQGEVNFLKQWYRDRLNFMDTNFVAKPAFSTNGGSVPPGFALSISGPLGASVYYTTDGTDPRLPGGAIAPGAKPYANALILTTNARVVARAFAASHHNLTGANNPPLSSPWSGLTAQTFVVAPLRIVVSELMYHPAAPPAGSTNSSEDFEYLELKNVGSTPVDLTGASFTHGIEFAFAAGGKSVLGPGQARVVVGNQTAFRSRYPGVTNIAGEYLGNLDNSGERLTLVGPMLEPIFDFTYNNSWYPVTDGLGFSLVIVNENAPADTWSFKESWRPSGRLGGSPGAVDPLPPAFPSVLINEALTHTDLPQVDTVELLNETTLPADIGGWFLTDDFSHPQKYRFPNGTTIQPGNYLAIDETLFNDGSPNSFALSSLSDSVYLFSGDSQTNLSGFFHGFKFGAAKNGVSFGRYVTSVGEEHFVAQVTNSLGRANVGPLVGPVVINEIMFDPAPNIGTNNDTIDEFIELRNITDRPVSLFDPDFPTNTWQISGGIDFTFPANLVLSSDEHILLVNFDPVHQPAQLAEFRGRYGVSTNTLIIGPYGGALGNSGDQVSLFKPDSPETAVSPNPGFVPYVLVDEVDYGTGVPWPDNANAIGLSLQRIDSGLYGNDPINWLAALPTPGQPNMTVLPSLSITASGGELVLSWPQWASDFTLESSGELRSSSAWSPITNGVSISGGKFVVTTGFSATTSFFRLHK